MFIFLFFVFSFLRKKEYLSIDSISNYLLIKFSQLYQREIVFDHSQSNEDDVENITTVNETTGFSLQLPNSTRSEYNIDLSNSEKGSFREQELVGLISSDRS